MTTTNHAAPWTFRRVFADLFYKPARDTSDLMTGREALARTLFGECENWDPAQMADYDNSQYLSRAWLAVADRRIEHRRSHDRHVAAFHGIRDADWIHLPSLAKVDHREAYYRAQGM